MLSWKVCGMRDPENIKEVLKYKPDFMGLIFYAKSARYVDSIQSLADIDFGNTKKVGVFVNEVPHNIMMIANELGLDYVQLHGDESLEEIRKLKGEGLKIIKAIRVNNQLPVVDLKRMEPYVDYFLFDTKTEKYGGSGKRFDWDALNEYDLSIPFLISGGIGSKDIEEVQSLNFPNLTGIDFNSKCEINPGLKDPDIIQEISKSIKIG